jgi:predicted nucleic acid-binding protein
MKGAGRIPANIRDQLGIGRETEVLVDITERDTIEVLVQGRVENTFKDAMSLSVEKGIRINDAMMEASMKQNNVGTIVTTNEKDLKLAWVKIENPLVLKAFP